MKIKKNKIVFISVLVVVVLFIVAYSIWTFGKNNDKAAPVQETELPALDEDEQKDYDSRLDAVDDLENEQERDKPGVYDDRLMDSLGNYDRDLKAKEKERLVDSVLKHENTEIPKEEASTASAKSPSPSKPTKEASDVSREQRDKPSDTIGSRHRAFFKGAPEANQSSGDSSDAIVAIVDGQQMVRADARLRMRLQDDFEVDGTTIPKNTPVYGTVAFQPNRLLIDIETIDHQPVELKAYDQEDGREGIYVENNTRSEVQDEMANTTLG